MNIMSIQQKILDFENEFDKFTTFTIRYEKISIITLKILKLLITGYIRKNCSFYLARARQLALVAGIDPSEPSCRNVRGSSETAVMSRFMQHSCCKARCQPLPGYDTRLKHN